MGTRFFRVHAHVLTTLAGRDTGLRFVDARLVSRARRFLARKRKGRANAKDVAEAEGALGAHLVAGKDALQLLPAAGAHVNLGRLVVPGAARVHTLGSRTAVAVVAAGQRNGGNRKGQG